MDNTAFIYLDNAATSYPKPSGCMQRALDRYLQLGASPSRGGYDLAREAEAAVSEVRHKLCRFFGADAYYPLCFGSNATDALNTLIQGLAFTGHKSLLGPSGIGGLIVHPDLPIRPTRFGGTGIDSASLFHTQAFPYRLEAGTLNLLGILALGESLSYLHELETQGYRQREMALTEKLRDALSEIDGIDLYAAQISLGVFNRKAHIDAAISAMSIIARNA